MTDIIKLVTEGEVQLGEQTFTRLIGGFNEDEPILTDLQVAKALGYKKGARAVRQRVLNNITHFEKGLHILDLKERDPQRDTFDNTLNSLGYAKQSIAQAENIFLFSKAGFLLFLKFADGEKQEEGKLPENKSVEVYKAFIEDYFKTKAENKVMKSAIENQMDILKQEKKDLYGELIVAENELERATFLMKLEEKNKQITSLQSSLDQEKLIEKLQPKLKAGELIENSKSSYDIGTFAKVLAVKELGRTNLFKWLKQKKFLRANREPYQQYMDYFSVKYVPNQNGVMYPKTLIKPKGVLFVIKYLIKDGIVLTKTSEEILSELETSLKVT